MFKLEETFVEHVNKHSLDFLQPLQTTQCFWLLEKPQKLLLCFDKRKKKFIRASADKITELDCDDDELHRIMTRDTVTVQTCSAHPHTNEPSQYKYYIPSARENVSCLLIFESVLELDKPEVDILLELTRMAQLVCLEIENYTLHQQYIDERAIKLSQEQIARKEHDELTQIYHCMDTLHDLGAIFIDGQNIQGVLTQLVKVLRKSLSLNQVGIFLFADNQNLLTETCVEDSIGNVYYQKFFQPTSDDIEQFLKYMTSKHVISILERQCYIEKCKFCKQKTVFLRLQYDEINLGAALLEYKDVVDLNTSTSTILNWIADSLKTCIYLKRSEIELNDYSLNIKKVMKKRIDDYYTQVETLKKENAQLSKLTLQDPLTGLANRRGIDIALEREFENAKRHRYPLTLMILDVDFFKEYNDFYGHDAGDQCLQRIAHVLQVAERRKGSLIARFGGDEFLILLIHQAEDESQVLIERIQQELAKEAIAHEKSKVTDVVTLSIGCASSAIDEDIHWDALFARADKALYCAKERGRNQVFFFPEETSNDVALPKQKKQR